MKRCDSRIVVKDGDVGERRQSGTPVTGSPSARNAADGVARATPDAPSAARRAPLTDDLVARAVHGDHEAFAALYLQIQPGLRRYAGALVGQDADDVTAEAWLQIARDIGRFSGSIDNFRAWTARVVRNRAMDSLRYDARRPSQPTHSDELLDTVADDDTADAAIEHLSTAAATELIASLPRDQAEAVLLRAVVGLDAAAAGQVLGKSAAAVRVAAHRGLKKLAAQLERGHG